MKNQKLNLTELSDFHYLLSLLPVLADEPEYECLPELFSILGPDKLLLLCKFAGGSTVRIPTTEELSVSMEALEWFYLVYIKKCKYKKSIPDDLVPMVDRIRKKFEGVI